MHAQLCIATVMALAWVNAINAPCPFPANILLQSYSPTWHPPLLKLNHPFSDTKLIVFHLVKHDSSSFKAISPSESLPRLHAVSQLHLPVHTPLTALLSCMCAVF